MSSYINIITEDNYFFIGVKEYLHREDVIVRKIHPRKLKSIPRGEFREGEFFIFYTLHYVDEFSFLIATDPVPGKLIFIPISDKVKSHIAFKGYTTLEPYAGIDSISNAMQKGKNNNTNLHLAIDKLTKREKSILLDTINGMNAQSISQSLSISIKTVYTHRRNALHKLGSRNFFEILPMRERIIIS